jgi:hypothetical protein
MPPFFDVLHKNVSSGCQNSCTRHPNDVGSASLKSTCKGNLHIATPLTSVVPPHRIDVGSCLNRFLKIMKTRDKTDKDTTTQLKTLTKLFTDRISLHRSRGYTQKQILSSIHTIRKPFSIKSIGLVTSKLEGFSSKIPETVVPEMIENGMISVQWFDTHEVPNGARLERSEIIKC